jgi:tRNA(Ile)-lysidine synthase
MHSFLSDLSAALPKTGFWEAPAIVAVSGGADSVALLVGLARVAPPQARLIVAHACHDLRPDAPADRDFVAVLAARLHVPCESRALAVRDDAEGRGEGLEARARRLRYDFFIDAAHAHGARHVVVGHTADDQAETILHRALRGTGLAGLAGMQRSRRLADGVALLRPLLHLPRALGREFLEAEGERWAEDATNADPAFARNFLRHEILARAERGPYPAATAALVRLGEHAGRSAAALRSAAERLLEIHSQCHADGRIVLDATALVGLDRHLVAEVVVALWEREDWPRRDMAAHHYAAIAGLIIDVGSGAQPFRPAFDLPGGVRAGMPGPGRIDLHRQAPVQIAQ